jgi:CheY-like chemotaxis protein
MIISANINDENIEIAYKKGAVDFIKKPFFKPELEFKNQKGDGYRIG